jgi:WD40 repeat protein
MSAYQINAVIWSEDDRRLVSCGQDGAVYEWSIPFGNRISEVVLKGKEIVDIALVPSSNHIYAVDSRRVIRQLVDSQVSIITTTYGKFCNVFIVH